MTLAPRPAVAVWSLSLSRLGGRDHAAADARRPVRGYFSRWMNALPDIPALAAADEVCLHQALGGLGYYSRVRNLHRAAACCEEYGRRLPAQITTGVLALPGVGEYTAGAVASIASWTARSGGGRQCSRWRCGWITISRRSRTQELKQTRERFAALMPSDRPGDLNQSLMELSATVLSAERRTARRLPDSASLRGLSPRERGCAALQAAKKARRAGKPHRACCALRLRLVSLRQRPKKVCLPVCGSCPRWTVISRRTSCARRSPKWDGACESCSLCGLPSIFSPMWSGT